jgi:hypothetical protein
MCEEDDMAPEELKVVAGTATGTRTDTATPAEPVEEAPVRAMEWSAAGNLKTGPLTASRSALANTTVTGDVEATVSALGLVTATRSVRVKQSVAGAVFTEGKATVEQVGTTMIIGGEVAVDNSVGGLLVADTATVNKSWVGLLASRSATVSENSRVLIDWKAALILAAVVLGLAGVVAVLAVVVWRRTVGRIAHLGDRMPHLPEIPGWVRTLAKMRHAA